MKKWFPSDAVFKEQLESALTVELCSECAGEEVCVDVVTVIVELLTPRFASMEELHSEGVDWNDTEKAIIRIAQLELREGRVLGEGFYIRAAISQFGNEKWLQLMVSASATQRFALGAWFFFVKPGVSPNEVVFDLIIPPIGNPLREELSFPTDSRIQFSILDTAVNYELENGVGLVAFFKEYLRGDKLWEELALCNVRGSIPAVLYSAGGNGSTPVTKKGFTYLLPDESALSDVEFWQTHCPEAVAELFKSLKYGAEEHFREWVSAEVWQTLASTQMAQVQWLERELRRVSTVGHEITLVIG